MRQRVLKFRVWNYRSMSYHNNAVGVYGRNDDNFMVADIADFECVNPYHEPPDDVMQFTNGEDCTGQEVWEKDIVKDEHAGFLGVVMWYPEYFSYRMQLLNNTERSFDLANVCFSVVGNVYEPPTDLSTKNLETLLEFRTNGCRKGFKEREKEEDEDF